MSSLRFSLGMEMSRLMRDGTAEPVSRDHIHVQDWQPYPVDPYSCYYMCDHTSQSTAARRMLRDSISKQTANKTVASGLVDEAILFCVNGWGSTGEMMWRRPLL